MVSTYTRYSYTTCGDAIHDRLGGLVAPGEFNTGHDGTSVYLSGKVLFLNDYRYSDIVYGDSVFVDGAVGPELDPEVNGIDA